MLLRITILLILSSLTLSAAEIDLKSSKITWKATKKLGDSHMGKLPIKSSTVKMEKEQIVKAEITVDMTKFTVDDLEGTWKKKFLAHVKSGDFFEVGKYPTAKLVIEKQIGNLVKGQLTIKGKTHPVSIEFQQKGKTYSGTMTFDRTKYGITYNSANFFKKLVESKIIKNEIELTFSITLK